MYRNNFNESVPEVLNYDEIDAPIIGTSSDLLTVPVNNGGFTLSNHNTMTPINNSGKIYFDGAFDPYEDGNTLGDNSNPWTNVYTDDVNLNGTSLNTTLSNLPTTYLPLSGGTMTGNLLITPGQAIDTGSSTDPININTVNGGGLTYGGLLSGPMQLTRFFSASQATSLTANTPTYLAFTGVSSSSPSIAGFTVSSNGTITATYTGASSGLFNQVRVNMMFNITTTTPTMNVAFWLQNTGQTLALPTNNLVYSLLDVSGVSKTVTLQFTIVMAHNNTFRFAAQSNTTGTINVQLSGGYVEAFPN